MQSIIYLLRGVLTNFDIEKSTNKASRNSIKETLSISIDYLLMMESFVEDLLNLQMHRDNVMSISQHAFDIQ